MNIKLLPVGLLAVAGFSSSAFAQSSVEIFGTIDLGYERVTGKLNTQSGLGNSANASSSVGFRGKEDLGGGTSVGFWLEMGVMPSIGTAQGTYTNNQSSGFTGTLFGRRSILNLTGNFGEVRLGRDYVPSFWNYAFYDPFGASSVAASINNFTGTGDAATFVRASNSVSYLLPSSFGGLNGQVTYAFGENPSNQTGRGNGSARDTSSNGNYFGARLGYAQGPVDIAVSTGKTKYASGTNALAWFGYGGIQDLTSGRLYGQQRGWLL